MGGRALAGGSMLGPSLKERHMPDLLTAIPLPLGGVADSIAGDGWQGMTREQGGRWR